MSVAFKTCQARTPASNPLSSLYDATIPVVEETGREPFGSFADHDAAWLRHPGQSSRHVDRQVDGRFPLRRLRFVRLDCDRTGSDPYTYVELYSGSEVLFMDGPDEGQASD